MSAFLRKYGTGSGADIHIPIIAAGVADFAGSSEWTPAAGDVKISKNGGAAANIGTLPVALTMGNGSVWKFVFSDAELQAKSIIVTVVDSATKDVEDQSFIIETYGHASAMYQADLSAANLPANVTQLLGTAWLTPGVAGTPDVNTKTMGATAVSAIWDALVAGITTANSIGKRIIDYLTGDIFLRLGAPAGASAAADIAAVKSVADAVKAKTDLIPAGGPPAASDYTAPRAALLDNLDATISSRLASAGYTAPDNAGIGTAAAAASAAAGYASTAAAQSTTAAANSTTILARLGAFTGTGINTILGFFRALMRKDAALTPSDVGGTFDNTTDSNEAMKDAGASGGLTSPQDEALTRIDRTVKGIASRRE